jgi:hypothetical protein
MRVSDLGQMRPLNTDYTMYSKKSMRPPPFKSERELIDDGQAEDLIPPWGNMDWPKFVPPPPIPDPSGENIRIKREMRARLWPHIHTWNLNEDPMEGLGEMAPMGPVAKKALWSSIAGIALVAASSFIPDKMMLIKKTTRHVGYFALGFALVATIGLQADLSAVVPAVPASALK